MGGLCRNFREGSWDWGFFSLGERHFVFRDFYRQRKVNE